MPTQILAGGTGAANSSDVTVAAGESLTVCIKGSSAPNIPTGARIDVQIRDDVGAYWRIDSLSWANPAVVLSAGVYRLRRTADSESCGAFSG